MESCVKRRGSVGKTLRIYCRILTDRSYDMKEIGVPVAITKTYINPYWHGYYEGLAEITSPDRGKGPIQSEKCGHFVQRDDPDFVV